MKYSFCYCAICYCELRRPQNTCGSAECLDAWRHLNRDTRAKRLNLASMPPSERAYALATQQTPTPQPDQPPEPQLEEPTTPSFIRDMLSPENLKPKGKL